MTLMTYNCTRRRGLTLIELIAALLILQIILVVLVQTLIRGIQVEGRVEDRARAALVGQAVMDAVLRDASSQGVSLSEPGVYPEEPQPINAESLGLDPAAVEGLMAQITVAEHAGSTALREITLSLTWNVDERERRIKLVSLAQAAT